MNQFGIYLKLAVMAAGLAGILAILCAAAPAGPQPQVTDVAMRADTDALLQTLGQLRRIPPRGSLARQLVTQVEMRAEMEAVLQRQSSPVERETEERMLQRLGLIPDATDYTKTLIDALTAKPGSFYDPLSRRLYVPSWIDLRAQRASLAHEIGHALADQRFGLRRALGFPADGRPVVDTDRQRARQALIEGDAATLTLELLDPKGLFLSGRELGAMVQRIRVAVTAPPAASVPPFVREVLAFPTVEGLAFLARVRARESWSAVDAIWARPPDSTEQVLHPERYDRSEPPVSIQTAPLPPLESTHRVARIDTLGELTLRLWLARFAPAPMAERAADGWGGDRIVVYLPTQPAGAADAAAEPAGIATLAWLTVWDSVADAEDFATTATAALAGLAGPPLATPSGAVVSRDASGRVFALARSGDRVALLLGAPEQALGALNLTLTTWKSVVTKTTPAASAQSPAAKSRPRPQVRPAKPFRR